MLRLILTTFTTAVAYLYFGACLGGQRMRRAQVDAGSTQMQHKAHMVDIAPGHVDGTGLGGTVAETNSTDMKIPKLIHMAFVPKTPGVGMPESFHINAEGWQRAHPGWELWQWDAESNRHLVQKHYPWFLSTYDGFDKEIKRLDASRYLYMHRYGGVYTDMDSSASREITPYLEGYDMVLQNRGGAIQNYFIASVPGHPLWLKAVYGMEAVATLPFAQTPDMYDDVLCAVGWPMLTRVWTSKFSGKLEGNGALEDAQYMVFSEEEFNTKLGLNHAFSAQWLSFMSVLNYFSSGEWLSKKLSSPAPRCERAQPGWTKSLSDI